MKLVWNRETDPVLSYVGYKKPQKGNKECPEATERKTCEGGNGEGGRTLRGRLWGGIFWPQNSTFDSSVNPGA